MAVSASQTSFTPGLKLHAPAANEGTIRANGRSQNGRDVHYWHLADIPDTPALIRYWSNSGYRARALARTRRKLRCCVHDQPS
jgi:hypothetical protein